MRLDKSKQVMSCWPHWLIPLKKVKKIVEVLARLGFDVLAYKVRKLVRVLAHGWDTDGSAPVEVQICELKSSKIYDACEKMHKMKNLPCTSVAVVCLKWARTRCEWCCTRWDWQSLDERSARLRKSHDAQEEWPRRRRPFRAEDCRAAHSVGWWRIWKEFINEMKLTYVLGKVKR